MALADFLVSLLTVVSIYTLLGLGLNIKFGFTGLVDFGHVLYFLVGAYVTVVLAMPAGTTGYQGIGGFGLPGMLSALPLGGVLGWLLALAIAMVAAALVSLVVGVPTLRLREDYLAITALGVATIFHAVVNDERWLFNGPFGVRDVYHPLQGAFPVSLGSFLINLGVFGLVSVVVLGYLGYRVARYVRPIDRRPAVCAVAAVVLVGAGLGIATLGGALLLVGPLVAAAGVWVLARGIRLADGFGRPLALFAAVLFAVWYFGTPVITGGAAGVVANLVWLFDPTVGDAGGFTYGRFVLLVSVAFLAFAYWWCERTVNSPYGRVLRSIREDESVPEALGKRTFRYKVQSMMFGSALAGAAGGLWATHIGFIDPSQFTAEVTFFAFTAVIIGGTANNLGVVLGTLVFWTLYTGTRFLNDFFPAEWATQLAAIRLMFIGVLLIVILYYRSEGLLGRQSADTGVAVDGGGDSD
jgi:neutral amino acid transport system permease protein